MLHLCRNPNDWEGADFHIREVSRLLDTGGLFVVACRKLSASMDNAIPAVNSLRDAGFVRLQKTAEDTTFVFFRKTAETHAIKAPGAFYQRCFDNEEGPSRIHGHIGGGTIDDCAAVAVVGNNAYFGVEFPEGYGISGYAACLPLQELPPRSRAVSDEECDGDGLQLDGRRLGGKSRLAVYETKAWADWSRPGFGPVVACDSALPSALAVFRRAEIPWDSGLYTRVLDANIAGSAGAVWEAVRLLRASRAPTRPNAAVRVTNVAWGRPRYSSGLLAAQTSRGLVGFSAACKPLPLQSETLTSWHLCASITLRGSLAELVTMLQRSH